MYEYLPACLCATYVQYPHRPDGGPLEPLELELDVVISHTMWALGTKPGSLRRAASPLDLGAISSPRAVFDVLLSN